jgi:hypothetical protein
MSKRAREEYEQALETLAKSPIYREYLKIGERGKKTVEKLATRKLYTREKGPTRSAHCTDDAAAESALMTRLERAGLFCSPEYRGVLFRRTADTALQSLYDSYEYEEGRLSDVLPDFVDLTESILEDYIDEKVNPVERVFFAQAGPFVKLVQVSSFTFFQPIRNVADVFSMTDGLHAMLTSPRLSKKAQYLALRFSSQTDYLHAVGVLVLDIVKGRIGALQAVGASQAVGAASTAAQTQPFDRIVLALNTTVDTDFQNAFEHTMQALATSATRLVPLSYPIQTRSWKPTNLQDNDAELDPSSPGECKDWARILMNEFTKKQAGTPSVLQNFALEYARGGNYEAIMRGFYEDLYARTRKRAQYTAAVQNALL